MSWSQKLSYALGAVCVLIAVLGLVAFVNQIIWHGIVDWNTLVSNTLLFGAIGLLLIWNGRRPKSKRTTPAALSVGSQ